MSEEIWNDAINEGRLNLAASAIANARGARRGAPNIKNILELLPQKLRDEVMDDARAVLTALGMDARPDSKAGTP